MPTLNHSKTPEWQTWDQQDAEEAARQASGAPPSLPPGIHSGGVVAPPPADYGGYSNTNSVLTASGLETSFEPLPYNIGLLDDPEFCRLTETLLIIRESQSMFEGHEYQLKDSSGQVIIEVKGHAISLHDTKDIYSADGTKLFILKNKLVSVRRTFEGESIEGAHLFEITRQVGGAMKCTFANMALENEVRTGNRGTSTAAIVLRGNFHDGTGDLVYERGDDQVTIAQVRHTVAGEHNFVRDQSTYYVKVAARVDLALLGTICLCFDQLREKKGEK